MKALLKSFVAWALLVGFVSAAHGAWTYYAADAAGNPTEVDCVTDGNWIFQVSTWGETSFKTVRSANSGCLAGSGVLDLSETTEQLGRTWDFAGGWDGKKWGSAFSGNASITEVILPNEMTSICMYAFQGCSELTKVTVPSGYLSSMDKNAFANCSKLSSFSPQNVICGTCATIGSDCFTKCTALKTPLKWKMDGDLSASFVNTAFPEIDVSEVKGNVSISGYGDSFTNVVWSPTVTKIPLMNNGNSGYERVFSSVTSFYFPGVVPYESTLTMAPKKNVRIFGDPQMDSQWNELTQFGVQFARPSDADITTYATRYGVSESEARESVLGVVSSGTAGYYHWLVKWKSPLNDGGFPFAAKVSRPEVGSVTVVPDKSKFEEGDSVSITANPAPGYAFAYWRGTLPAGIDIHSAVLNVTVAGACDLEAVITNTLGWTHREATDDEPELVTDGNWAFKVSRWNGDEGYFQTVRCTQGGYICGEGTLDLRDSAAQLGRRWNLEGGWAANEHSGTFAGLIKINEAVLPKETTAVPAHLFRGCSTLTKVTVPSGYLTEIGYSAFSGCSLLREVVPVSAVSDRCATYGENAFNGCALAVPLKWKLDGDLNVGTGFVLAQFSSLDMGEVMGRFIYSGYSYSVPTNTVWGPNMTTFVNFGNEQTITFTGKVPESNLSDAHSSAYRVYCDPAMDAGWRGETVAGVGFARPTDAQRETFVAKFGAAEVSKLISVSTNGNIYLVKKVSPYRRGGMKLVFR